MGSAKGQFNDGHGIAPCKEGLIIVDDYGHWEGSKKAVDEYISENQLPILLNRVDYSARIAVKIP
jgi:O-methyltransferase